ncbi:acyl-coenzyme A synthetase/AMP-(fatty) acid ligase [Roseiarcus fermentans]|uniref:Acyl-coenzyme A synthetase/AMP-(Fatty) acid ligase n=1 Tax=Roseiarcus fermentans TaxID=1473586 RepID=A0A366EQJ1_9HYPH|nr:acyl-CoA synthetase [Roseiarcus fermentans]RBP04641.1 acyl-coenzyme A synthetase/AMP-(fatty) acid ligase [Roseiarcus fermentans]
MPIPADGRFNLAWHCLGRQARARGGKIALIIAEDPDTMESWTYAELDAKVRRLAGGLAASGLSKGDRVMIRAGNDVEAVLAIFATIAIGCVAQPASPMLTVEEVRALAADSGAAAIVLDDADPAVRAALASLVVFDHGDVVRLAAESAPADYAPTAADDPAYLVYTSGSTAEPKGVLHGHRVVIGREPMHADWLGLTGDDVVLHAGNINWTYTLGVGVLDPFARGATGVLYAGPRDPGVWPRLIEATGTTLFAAVPSLYRQALKYGDPSRMWPTRLRHGVTAGEALSPDLLAHWREATGTGLYEALGMSEISTYVSSRPDEPVRPGSPGRPQRGRRVAVLPVEGGTDPLRPGEIGLLAVHRSDPGLMLGYWNRPEEEAAAFRGEWFLGGDLAEFDADGWVWHRGRNNDIMNAFGYRVSPLEVEKALAAHPDVADVAVAERTVSGDVSVIAAFVVGKPGRAPDEAALLAHAAARLAVYKRPRRIVFVDAIPHTPNGKVSRRLLPQLIA